MYNIDTVDYAIFVLCMHLFVDYLTHKSGHLTTMAKEIILGKPM